MFKLPHHEFWPGRLYEFPGYLYLLGHCLVRGIGLKTLFKANYALPYGGASFASKFKIQQVLGVSKFPPTLLLKQKNKDLHLQKTITFAKEHGYPFILKPDYGFTGRGVFKVQNHRELETILPALNIDYLAQAFVPATVEFGVFYICLKGQASILGMNQKHFPTVTGDGVRNLQTLANQHERYTHFWDSYLSQHDLTQVLKKGEECKLSDIGSHTLGCKFTHDLNCLTPALEQAVVNLLKDTPGFNYGRLDLLSDSLESFKKGIFTMVEANGIESLPTNIFDPQLSVWASYRILFKHLKKLAQIAAENRTQPSEKISRLAFIKKSLTIKKEVEAQQDILEKIFDFKKLNNRFAEA